MAVSAPLMGLLRYTKTENPDLTWKGLANALAPFYFEKMKLIDVVQVMVRLYEEALTEPRFELGNGSAAYLRLLLAPIKGHHAIDWPAPKNGLESSYTVEQYYNAVVGEMASSLRITRVDWCFSDAEGQVCGALPSE